MVPAIGQTAGRWMTVRYGLALVVIAICTLVAHIMTERVISQHQDTLEVVNLSGRQRMLSQRAALLVGKIGNTPDAGARAALIPQLDTVVTMFENAHRRLTGTGPEPGLGLAIRDLYFAGPEPLNDRVQRFIASLRLVMAAAPAGLPPDFGPARLVTEEALGSLLDRLDEMVARYQENGEEAFRTLRDLGLAALVITLLTLGAEVMVIFRPMVRQVQRQFAEITRMAERLERSNEHLEEQVRLRTAELHAAKDAAEQAHRAKSRFLSYAGHDLKQPLEAIGMFTGMLERQVTAPRGQALLRDMRSAQRSMRDLLNAILEISKLESGVVVPRFQAVALAPILDQLAAELAPAAEGRGLRFSAPPTAAVVRTDPFLLERILRNFLTNALRYTETGGVLIGCRRRGGALWVEVHDTGRGIPEADRNRIFEEFIQLDRPDRDRSEGIGLGLAIADRLARLLGHPVRVWSQEGRGSVFAVGLPPAAADTTGQTSRSRPSSLTSSTA